MHDIVLLLQAAWRVLLVSVVLGAGLPTLFAFGVKLLAHGKGGRAEIHSDGRRHVASLVAGYVCFALVAGAILLGIAIIVASGFGKTVSFEHVWPTFVDKHK